MNARGGIAVIKHTWLSWMQHRSFFFLLAFRALCRPGGLADAHFRWQQGSLRVLRRELYILLFTFIPAAFITSLIIQYDSDVMGGGVGRIAFVILLLALAGYNDFTMSADRPDIPAREMQIHYITDLARLAADLGAPAVRVFTAFSCHEVPFNTQWNWTVEGLRECARRRIR